MESTVRGLPLVFVRRSGFAPCTLQGTPLVAASHSVESSVLLQVDSDNFSSFCLLLHASAILPLAQPSHPSQHSSPSILPTTAPASLSLTEPSHQSHILHWPQSCLTQPHNLPSAAGLAQTLTLSYRIQTLLSRNTNSLPHCKSILSIIGIRILALSDRI